MSKPAILLVDHPVSERDDHASARLASMGYEIDWCCPGKGEVLPPPGSRHVAALVYGGAESANDGPAKPHIAAELAWIEHWLKTGKPLLGICLGSQLLAHTLGARIGPHQDGKHEIGYFPVSATAQGAAEGFVNGLTHVYQWHEEGFEVPSGCDLLMQGGLFPNQAFRYGRHVYGLQFHPEVTAVSLNRWMQDGSFMADEPQADPPERQLADAAKFHAPMTAWFDQFLARWLKDAG